MFFYKKRLYICIILFFATSCYYYYCINKLKNSIKLKLGEVDHNKIKIEQNEFEYTTAQIEAPQFKQVTTIDTKEAKKTKLILFWEPCKYYRDEFVTRCRHSCVSSTNKSLIKEADAVIMHGWIFPEIKMPEYRRNDQRWIYLLNESPVNTQYHSPQIIYKDFNGLFNWTMTYRSDSDIQILIWQLEKLKKTKKITNYFKAKTKFAAALISNCKNQERIKLVKEMQKYAPNMIDLYGSCGVKCGNNCNSLLHKYKFYLSFENSFNCKDYITEKFWKNGFEWGAIPVVKGAIKKDFLNQKIPANSFIHVDDFKSTKDLVNYMLKLSKNAKNFNKYHEWRKQHKIKYNFIKHWCDLCNKLHEDTEEKVYDDFEDWFNSCKNFHAG